MDFPLSCGESAWEVLQGIHGICQRCFLVGAPPAGILLRVFLGVRGLSLGNVFLAVPGSDQHGNGGQAQRLGGEGGRRRQIALPSLGGGTLTLAPANMEVHRPL